LKAFQHLRPPQALDGTFGTDDNTSGRDGAGTVRISV
jgi:hypothetical protein